MSRITAVETQIIRVPFDMGAPPRAFAGVTWRAMDTLFVRVITEDGVEGFGEGFGHATCAATRAVIETQLAPAVIGQDARDIRGIHARLSHALHLFGRNGPHIYALSALDTALWDIAGKAAGLPIWRLLGATPPTAFDAYASLLRYGEPDSLGAAVERAVHQGYRSIKLHEIDVTTIAAARDAAPEAALMNDCNCPWPVDKAIEIARALEPLDLMWLEEPVWPPEDHDGLARVRIDGGVPIAAGENAGGVHDFRSLFEAEAVDFAQPSVAKVGGLTEMLKIAGLAEAMSVRVVPHCAYFGPGFLASLHLQAALAPDAVFERLFVDLEASPYHDAVVASGGKLLVPDGSGLGRDPDPAVLDRYRVGTATLTKG